MLNSNMTIGCFDIGKDGIRMAVMAPERKVSLDLFLDASSFDEYEYTDDKNIQVGVNVLYMYKMLRCIKPKDSLELTLTSPSSDHLPDYLVLSVRPQHGKRLTKSYIALQDLQAVRIMFPDGYAHKITINSTDFQKAAKDIGSSSDVINLQVTERVIVFRSLVKSLFEKEVIFGDATDDKPLSDDELKEPAVFNETFDSEYFMRIAKVYGLSKDVQIYPRPGYPLMLKCDVGTLGTLRVFIKSREFLEKNPN